MKSAAVFCIVCIRLTVLSGFSSFNKTGILGAQNLKKVENNPGILAAQNLPKFENNTGILAAQHLTVVESPTGLLEGQNLTTVVNHTCLLEGQNLTTVVNHTGLLEGQNLTTVVNHTGLLEGQNLTTVVNPKGLLEGQNLTTVVNHTGLLECQNLTTVVNHKGLLECQNLTTVENYTGIRADQNLTKFENHTVVVMDENHRGFENRMSVLTHQNMSHLGNHTSRFICEWMHGGENRTEHVKCNNRTDVDNHEVSAESITPEGHETTSVGGKARTEFNNFTALAKEGMFGRIESHTVSPKSDASTELGSRSRKFTSFPQDKQIVGVHNIINHKEGGIFDERNNLTLVYEIYEVIEEDNFDHFKLTVPENMSFEETVLFWDSLVCPGKAVCNKLNDYNHFQRCPSITCTGCSCDQCDKHKECCVDEYLNVTNKTPYMSCRVSSPKSFPRYLPTGDNSYYFVDKCPENFNDSDIRASCELHQVLSTWKEEIGPYMPVFSLSTEINYYNSFCAKCHADDKQLKVWETVFFCSDGVDVSGTNSETELFSLLLDHPSCLLIGAPSPGSAWIPCEESSCIFITTCNRTGKWLSYDPQVERACALYENHVNIQSQSYRNIFCAFCNGISQVWLAEMYSNPHRCGSTPTPSPCVEGKSFAVLFKFTKSLPKINTFTKTSTNLKECLENMLYDPYTNTCRTLVCSKGRFISNHSCMDAYQTAKGVGYSVSLNLRHLAQLSDMKLSHKALGKLVVKYLKSHDLFIAIGHAYLDVNMNICSTHQTTPALVKEPFTEMNIDVLVVVRRQILLEEAEEKLLELFTGTWDIDGNTWAIYDTRAHVVIASNNSIQCAKYSKRERTGNFYLPQYYRLNPDAFIPVNKLISCNQIELEDSEYSMDRHTGNIELTWSNETLSPADFQIVNDTVRICVNYSGWYQVEEETIYEQDDPAVKKTNTLEVFLTLISVALSLAALLLTLMVCILTKSLKTMPGLITTTLIILIFLSQLLFLVSGYVGDYPWVCPIIGVIIHYFWISVFAWKNVAAYHMYVIFTKPLKHRHDSRVKTFLKYSLYGFGLPILIVGSYICARSVLSQNRTIGYGADGTCFLSRPVDVAWAFALPIGLVLISNMYFFARAIHVIRRMSEMDKSTNQTNTSHNALFVKMSVILGFTWVVGFIANIISQPFIWYTFIILNGGIGVLIFICQACNGNVVTILCGVFKGLSVQRSSEIKYSTRDSPVEA